MTSDLQRFIQTISAAPEYLILDTETTGLDHRAEICEIAIINHVGETLLNTRVKPKNAIPADASRIHGITNEMVANAPRWGDMRGLVADCIIGKPLIIYNADYDLRIMDQSDRMASVPPYTWHKYKTLCAMMAASEAIGDWNDYHGNYRWQKLTVAHSWFECPPVSAPAQSALGDCLMTLNITRALLERVKR